jgi:hypothetical protein
MDVFGSRPPPTKEPSLSPPSLLVPLIKHSLTINTKDYLVNKNNIYTLSVNEHLFNQEKQGRCIQHMLKERNYSFSRYLFLHTLHVTNKKSSIANH